MTVAADSLPYAKMLALHDFDALWNFSDPAATEAKFRDILTGAPSDEIAYRLELQTQIARCQGLQNKFNDAHRTLDQVQAQLAARTVEATSGGGAVKVVAKCDGTLASVKIDPQALNPADAQLLEDMILTATNQALTQAKEISNAEMGKITQGMNLPGMM